MAPENSPAKISLFTDTGVSVPFHLVLPIWKSVVSSAGGIYKNHPSWLGFSSLCFDYRNSMEAEPGRCRRTDGKKWRCSKDVVPDRKYCERHMHRGRQRSRKPVEGQVATNNSLLRNPIDSNIQLSISMPIGLELMTTNTTTSTKSNASSRLGFSPTSVFQTSTCKTEGLFMN
ncbi:growth-regulating factor 12-like isoform X2 [Tasmannia lanceolata]|uniref:growth-regulating factor 12-like isoform X2 n=1 Tax=Tasmannia lanceolata TaxID=3420 RepID=UPI00406401C0